MLSMLLTILISMTNFLHAEEYAPAPRDQLWQTLAMLAVLGLGFYFILWRPEQQRRRALEEKRSQMRKGDRVTAMGIIGTVDSIKKDTVILKMVDGSKIEFLKAAINEVGSVNDSQLESADHQAPEAE
ncbi:MAG: preprotein translocase subunit YajC [Chlamydiia bacterium]|nr:preprotein translocase subunit YajC [Chlamydiia bacterium]